MICRSPSRIPSTTHRVLFAALLSSFASGSWAVCSDAASGNPALTATEGSTCNASRTGYGGNNVAGATGNGSVLNLLAGTSLVTSSGSTYTLSSGGLNSGGVASEPASLVHALGDLSLTSRGDNSRALFIYAGANAANVLNKVQVDGNLVAMRAGRIGGAVVQNSGGVIEIVGSTRIGADDSTPAPAPVDGIRNLGTSGSNFFRNGLTIYSAATGIVNAAGLVQVQGSAANINSTGGTAINISAGTVDMPVPATITSGSGTAIIASGGQVALGNSALTSATPAAGSSLMTIGTQAVTVQGANGILASAAAGNTVQMQGGSVIANTGDAIAVNAPAAANEIHIQTGTLSANAGRAIYDGPGNGNTSVTLEIAAAISGSIMLGAGSDSLRINGTDLSNVALVDGGDDASTADGDIDRLTLSAINGPQPAAKFLNWERILLTGNSDLTWTGSALATGGGAVAGEAMGLVVDAGSTLRMQEAAFSVNGDLGNLGQLALNNGQAGDVLTVSGDYAGSGTLALDVVLGDSSSAADRLVVQGNTAAVPTTLAISNLAGAGAVTSGDGILVVQVSGTSAANAFALPAPGYIDQGGFRYQLVQVGGNWYLQAKAATPPASDASTALKAVPTLGSWALLLLSSMAAMFGMGQLRRRQR
ncbi:IPTL-CTERM sorting domain-containing protein [Comamonas sp. JUb58]|uniref:IPTL-CTERM sorting domain-containing protein n=1 Tax=Comamonas sp. JUb58 TaxID=2485114 RepID=UPI00105E9A2B|nr:IPTL-CTERM sorting domain-containing protein [Comamonas sp. JUb58]TDS76750.1 putative secreted protein (IPTL-CTERM system target) [Comamonas sp. JUb58]